MDPLGVCKSLLSSGRVLHEKGLIPITVLHQSVVGVEWGRKVIACDQFTV